MKTIYNTHLQVFVDGRFRNSFFCEETMDLFVIEDGKFCVTVEDYSYHYKHSAFDLADFCESYGFDLEKFTLAPKRIVKIYEENGNDR